MLGTRTGELPDCRPLLADPDDLTLVFQPIVDLAAATVAGYEALARFPGTAGPDVWFAAAAEAGVAAELEALAIHKALAAVPALPPDTFLTVNVSPHILGSAPVQSALATRPALHRVVIELTEHTPVHDLAVPGHQVGDRRLIGGRPPSALWRRRVL
jgi:EAL domain-containing protein (putative c-di-GMP-specific phosphodiesterase class I)